MSGYAVFIIVVFAFAIVGCALYGTGNSEEAQKEREARNKRRKERMENLLAQPVNPVSCVSLPRASARSRKLRIEKIAQELTTREISVGEGKKEVSNIAEKAWATATETTDELIRRENDLEFADFRENQNGNEYLREFLTNGNVDIDISDREETVDLIRAVYYFFHERGHKVELHFIRRDGYPWVRIRVVAKDGWDDPVISPSPQRVFVERKGAA